LRAYGASTAAGWHKSVSCGIFQDNYNANQELKMEREQEQISGELAKDMKE
jgi:hypothetical protein